MKPRRASLDPGFERDLLLLIMRAYGHTEESLRRIDAEEATDYHPVFDQIDMAFAACLEAILEEDVETILCPHCVTEYARLCNCLPF